MRPGEAFEIQCYEYLCRMYQLKEAKFVRKGGMDSTTSDIAVLKNRRVDYYIEAKDAAAQSGQFVLLPDKSTRQFIFSPRNHSEPNEMTKIIIDYMNADFDRFNNAGTAGQPLSIDQNVFSNWIIRHYKERNVKYFISKKGSVKNFVALVKNGSFLVRITDMTILIEKEFIYGSSKRPNPTDYYRKQHYQCG